MWRKMKILMINTLKSKVMIRGDDDHVGGGKYDNLEEQYLEQDDSGKQQESHNLLILFSSAIIRFVNCICRQGHNNVFLSKVLLFCGGRNFGSCDIGPFLISPNLN